MEAGGVRGASTIRVSGRGRFRIGDDVGGMSCKKLEVQPVDKSATIESAAIKYAARSAINRDVGPAFIGIRSNVSESLRPGGGVIGDKGRSGGVINSETGCSSVS